MKNVFIKIYGRFCQGVPIFLRYQAEYKNGELVYAGTFPCVETANPDDELSTRSALRMVTECALSSGEISFDDLIFSDVYAGTEEVEV